MVETEWFPLRSGIKPGEMSNLSHYIHLHTGVPSQCNKEEEIKGIQIERKKEKTICRHNLCRKFKKTYKKASRTMTEFNNSQDTRSIYKM